MFSKFRLTFVVLFYVFSVIQASYSQGLLDLIGTLTGDPGKKVEVSYIEGDKESKNEILLIKIHGVISESEEESFMDVKKDIIESIKKDVKLALKRDKIKAILIEVNSPGGEVTTCDVIYHHLSKIKSEKKPIVCLIGTIGASGGYYIACAADRILAHPTSIIGSIGVLMQGLNMEKLASLIGIKDVTIKSERTPKKDILSPFREMTPEERSMLTKIIDSMYDRFLDIVEKARGLDRKALEKLADGSIFTSSQALEKKLIDQIGYREDAFEQAMELAKISSAKLVKRKVKKNVIELFSELAEMNSNLKYFLTMFEKYSNGKAGFNFSY
ncbi:MAG: signal peptide peptidase SppA [Candidatus Riflebacteria bacterium]|nr:signal peptide peptidase SppA [Candidatus Riflebacteria bacterium]